MGCGVAEYGHRRTKHHTVQTAEIARCVLYTLHKPLANTNHDLSIADQQEVVKDGFGVVRHTLSKH